MTITHPSDPNLKVICQVGHIRAEVVLFIHHHIPKCSAQCTACGGDSLNIFVLLERNSTQVSALNFKALFANYKSISRRVKAEAFKIFGWQGFSFLFLDVDPTNFSLLGIGL